MRDKRVNKIKHEYYLTNKEKWKKGGKYYNYTPKEDRLPKHKLEVKQFLLMIIRKLKPLTSVKREQKITQLIKIKRDESVIEIDIRKI